MNKETYKQLRAPLALNKQGDYAVIQMVSNRTGKPIGDETIPVEELAGYLIDMAGAVNVQCRVLCIIPGGMTHD